MVTLSKPSPDRREQCVRHSRDCLRFLQAEPRQNPDVSTPSPSPFPAVPAHGAPKDELRAGTAQAPRATPECWVGEALDFTLLPRVVLTHFIN